MILNVFIFYLGYIYETYYVLLRVGDGCFFSFRRICLDFYVAPSESASDKPNIAVTMSQQLELSNVEIP